jgi:hypothetical protein
MNHIIIGITDHLVPAPTCLHFGYRPVQIRSDSPVSQRRIHPSPWQQIKMALTDTDATGTEGTINSPAGGGRGCFVAASSLPVPASDEEAEVGAELGERGGRGAAHAAGAAEHQHAGARGLVPLGRGGGWRRACSDHGHSSGGARDGVRGAYRQSAAHAAGAAEHQHAGARGLVPLGRGGGWRRACSDHGHSSGGARDGVSGAYRQSCAAR